MRSSINVVGMMAGLTMTLIPTAFADENLNCEAYGNAAIQHQSKNLQNKCGFTGGRWSDDYAGHVTWCKSPDVKMEHLTAEDRARTDALAECNESSNSITLTPGVMQYSGKTAQCNAYADGALLAAAKNKQYTCGLTGGRFSDNREGHFNWCMGQDEAAVTAEAKLRDDAVNACATQGSHDAACDLYAKAAVNIVADHTQICRKDHGNPDYQDLVEFCNRIGPINAINENKKLMGEIDHCKKFPPKETTVFNNPGGNWIMPNGAKKFLPVDVCNEKREGSLFGGETFVTCGEGAATQYCKSKGFDKSVDHETVDIKNPDDVMSTIWWKTKKPCHGNCSGFSMITCEKL